MKHSILIAFIGLFFLCPNFVLAQDSTESQAEENENKSQLNIMYGYAFPGNLNFKGEKQKSSGGNTYGIEILGGNDFIQGGLGFAVATAKDVHIYEERNLLFIPVYLLVRLTPIENKGLFAKMNFGMDIAHKPIFNNKKDDEEDDETGAYLGFSIGYEFKWGLITAIAWDKYWQKDKNLKKYGDDSIHRWNHNTISLMLGYRVLTK